jgi:predicted  nucleic acid-binding Zn-ribbon protein
MELFDKQRSDWEALEQQIDEIIETVLQLRATNTALSGKIKKMEEEKKELQGIKLEMEKRIKALIEKVNTIKE